MALLFMFSQLDFMQSVEKGVSQMCKNLDSPHLLTPNPKHERGAGGEGKELSIIGMLPYKRTSQFCQNMFVIANDSVVFA